MKQSSQKILYKICNFSKKKFQTLTKNIINFSINVYANLFGYCGSGLKSNQIFSLMNKAQLRYAAIKSQWNGGENESLKIFEQNTLFWQKSCEDLWKTSVVNFSINVYANLFGYCGSGLKSMSFLFDEQSSA